MSCPKKSLGVPIGAAGFSSMAEYEAWRLELCRGLERFMKERERELKRLKEKKRLRR